MIRVERLAAVASPGLLTLLVVGLLLACGSVTSPPPRPPSALELPTLFVLLDAVPLRTVAALYQEEPELFEGFAPPQPLVSTFPSATTAAAAGMFGAFGMSRPPGYEARFFDRDAGRVRGGGPISYGRIDTHWPDFFDWRVRSTLRKSIGFLRPLRFAETEIRRGVEAFLASDQSAFFVYIAATDGAAHLAGPGSLEAILRSLGVELRRARERRAFRAVLFSDHGIAGAPEGSTPLRNVRRDLFRRLEADGFDVRSRLRDEASVVVVRFGLLSSFVAFAREGVVPEVARLMSTTEGVELCAHPTGPPLPATAQPLRAVAVVSARGRAVVEARTGALEEMRYRPLEGDPLDYRSAPGAPSLVDRWVDRERWLEGTVDLRFPDAPYRLLTAFALVENPAGILCSLADGFMFGSALTEISGRLSVGRLRWTHGALDREDSLGFWMTDAPGAEARPRSFDQLLDPYFEVD